MREREKKSRGEKYKRQRDTVHRLPRRSPLCNFHPQPRSPPDAPPLPHLRSPQPAGLSLAITEHHRRCSCSVRLCSRHCRSASSRAPALPPRHSVRPRCPAARLAYSPRLAVCCSRICSLNCDAERPAGARATIRFCSAPTTTHGLRPVFACRSLDFPDAARIRIPCSQHRSRSGA